MVKQPKNNGVYADFDEEQAKERRKIIVVAVVTIVLILGLIAGLVIYSINSNKKSTQTPSKTDSSMVDEDASDGAITPSEGGDKGDDLETDGKSSDTNSSAPEAETTSEIASTGPTDLLALALACGGFTTVLAYFIESKKA